MSKDSQLRRGELGRLLLEEIDAVVNDTPAPLAKNLFADVILIDKERREIVIDGIVFPWATVAPGPEVQTGVVGTLDAVTISVLTRSVVTYRAISEDLTWIRDIAAEHKRKALAKFEGDVLQRRARERQDFDRRMAAIKRDPQVQKLRRIAGLLDRA